MKSVSSNISFVLAWLSFLLLQFAPVRTQEVQPGGVPDLSERVKEEPGRPDSSGWLAHPIDWCATEWTRNELVTNAVSGKLESRISSYVEVGNGINYLNSHGDWEGSSDNIEILAAGGAAAWHGPLKVRFPASLGGEALTVMGASNTVLHITPVGVYLSDYDSGRSVLLGAVRPVEGELVPPNRIVYRAAITEGLKADLVYTYTKGGFEADLVIVERPQVMLETLGLNPETTRLELINIVEGKSPFRFPRVLKPDPDRERRGRLGAIADLTDETLYFGGDLCLPLGRAFNIKSTEEGKSGTNEVSSPIHASDSPLDEGALPVAKTWTQFENGQQGLVEAVNWLDIKTKLDMLPPVGREGARANKQFRAEHGRRLPELSREFRPALKPMLIASGYRPVGVVLDYWTPSGNGPFTFTNATYFITNTLSCLNGISFSNSVIKFSSLGEISVSGGSISCFGPNPTVMTSENDNSVGQTLPSSTGMPLASAYPHAVILNGPASAQTLYLLDVRYARGGFQIGSYGYPAHTVSNCVFRDSTNCQYAVQAFGSQVTLINSTSCRIGTNTVASAGGTFIGSLTPATFAITTQPQNVTTNACGSAAFTVLTTAAPGQIYQWRFNGINIASATGSSLTLNTLSASNAGLYSVMVSNCCDAILSASATLAISPCITTQPQGLGVGLGSNATFTVVATGSAPLSYQWRFNGGNIPGATGTTFTTNGVSIASAGNYSVMVTNTAGSVTSSNAVLTILPLITTQPQSLAVALGSNATFTVVATGSTPLGYQWRFNGVNLAGATGTSLTTNGVSIASAGNYSVVVTNTAGSSPSSNAVLTILPRITTQPQSLTVGLGSNATFSVVATGSSPLNYQWRFNGASIASATGTSFTTNAVSMANAGNYSVVVTNAGGSVTSSNAVLTLLPCITTQPQSLAVGLGSNATFSVVATGSPPLNYQWRFNGASIASATGTSFTTNAVSMANAGNYSIVVTNAGGSVTSSNAVLTLLPWITTQPQSLTVGLGSNATFSVVATGSTPLSYQWRFNGGNIAGATGTSFTTNGVLSNSSGNYSVVVANVGGSLTSSNAVLTVISAPAATPTFLQTFNSTCTAVTNTATSATPGSIIYYTSNGVDPTTNSTCTPPVATTAGVVVKAMAAAPGYLNSVVASITTSATASTTFVPSNASNQNTPLCPAIYSEVGSTIYYKVGTSDTWQYTTSGGTVCLDGIDNGTGVIQAYAIAPNKLSSTTNTSGSYSFVAPTPTNSLVWSPDHRSVQVVLGPVGGLTRYTTDGSDPTGLSPAYSNSITLTATTSLKAINSKAGHSNSPLMVLNVNKLLPPSITDGQNLYQGEIPSTVYGTNVDVSASLAGPQPPVGGTIWQPSGPVWKLVKDGGAGEGNGEWNGWEGIYHGQFTGTTGDVFVTSGYYRQDTFHPYNYLTQLSFWSAGWVRPYASAVLACRDAIISDGQWHQYYCVTRLNDSMTNGICVDGPSWGYSKTAGSLYFTDLVWQKNPAVWPTNNATGTNYNDLKIVIVAPSGTVKWTSNNTDPALNTNTLQSTITPLLTGNSMSIARAVSWSDTALVSDEVRVTNQFVVAPFSVSPSQAFANTLLLTNSPSWTAGSILRYTNQSGAVGPPANANSSSSVWPGLQTISNSQYYSFIATKPDYVASAILNVTYTNLPIVATPLFAPVFNSTQTLVTNLATSTTPGATVYYTIDGTVPTLSSSTIPPVLGVGGIVVLAMAAAPGCMNSSIATNLTSAAIPVSFSPNGHDPVSYATNAIQVTCTAAPGSTIHYQPGTNASWHIWTSGSPFWLNGIDSGWGRIQAYATSPGLLASVTNASEEFYFRTPAPTTATSGDGITLTLSASAVSNATVYYTTDGSIPTTSSSVYTSPITRSASQTFAFIARLPGYIPSSAILASINQLNPPTVLSGSVPLTNSITVNNAFPIWIYPQLETYGNNYFEFGDTRNWTVGATAWLTNDVPNTNFQFSVAATNISDGAGHSAGVPYSMGHLYSGGIWMKSPSTSFAYAGLANLDANWNLVTPTTQNEPYLYSPSLTWNTQPITNGSTTVCVADANSFSPLPPYEFYNALFKPLLTFERHSAFGGLNQPDTLLNIYVPEPTGYYYSEPETVWVDSLDVSLNTLHLVHPYTGSTLSSGTALMRRCFNGWYQYFILSQNLDSGWKYYTNSISGVRPGSAWLGGLVLFNYYAAPPASTLFTGLELWEGTQADRPKTFFSTDNSDPFSKAPVTGPIKIVLDGNSQSNLKTAQKGTYYLNSPISQAVISFQVGTPSLCLNWASDYSSVVVTGVTATLGASIRYTLDGTSPSLSSPTLPATLFATNFVGGSNWVLAVAGFKSDYNNSVTVFTNLMRLPVVVFSPNGHDPISYATNALQMTCTATAGSTIHYQVGTNSQWQTTTSGIPFTVDGIDSGWGKVSAYATLAGNLSGPTNVSGEFSFRTPEPTTTTSGNGTSITVTATALSGSIFYTTDGSAPTLQSTPYTAPITSSSPRVLTFIAARNGYLPSSAVRTYVNQLATPGIYTTRSALSAGFTANNPVDLWIYPQVSEEPNSYFEFGNGQHWSLAEVMTNDTPNENIQFSQAFTNFDAVTHFGMVGYSKGHRYSEGVWLKSPNANSAYVGLVNYDELDNIIGPASVNEAEGYSPILTWNTQPITNGATTIYVANAAAFEASPPAVYWNSIFVPVTNFNRYASFPEINQNGALPNFYVPEASNLGFQEPSTMWVNARNTNLNTLTLAHPYCGPALPSGTPLARRTAHFQYQYPVLSDFGLSNRVWTYYSSSFTNVRAGTDSMDALAILNWDGLAPYTLITGLELWEGDTEDRPRTYYSTDGLNPFSKNPVIGPIRIRLDGNSQTNLQVGQKGTYYLDSPVTQRTFNFKVATPELQVVWESDRSSAKVSGYSITTDSIVHYTLNGTTPTALSPILPVTFYSSNYSTLTNLQITAAGFKPNYLQSDNALISVPMSYGTNLPPSVAITYPTRLLSIQGPTNVTFALTCSDPDGSVTNLVLLWRTFSNVVTLATFDHPSHSLTFVWSNIWPRQYAVEAMAIDDAGATNFSHVVVFKVASTHCPSVWITSPGNGTVLPAGKDFLLTAEANNGAIAITNVQFFQDGVKIARDAASPFEFGVTGLSPGTYRFTAQATDALGCSSNSLPITITISDWPQVPTSGRWDDNFMPISSTFVEWVQSHMPICVDSSNNVYFAHMLHDTQGRVDLWQNCSWGGASNLGSIYGITAIEPHNEQLYFGGGMFGFTNANVLRYEPNSPAPLADLTFGLNTNVCVLKFIKGELYAGGWFNSAGADTNVQFIARLNGDHWESVGNGLNGCVRAIASIGDDIYIGGDFTTAGGRSVLHIAKLVDTNWVGLGGGLDGIVHSLAVWKCKLIAGGDFIAAGGNTNVSCLAIWDGINWDGLGGKISGTNAGTLYDVPTVAALAVYGNELFIGGMFLNASTARGDFEANHIAHLQWNEGRQEWIWYPLEQGMVYDENPGGGGAWVDGLVVRLTPKSTELIVGGGFNKAGSVPSHRVARWIVGELDCPTNPPSLYFTSPIAYGFYLTNWSIPVQVKAISADDGIRDVTFYVDGEPLAGTPQGDDVYANQIAFSTAGVHRIDAVAIQYNGLCKKETVYIGVDGGLSLHADRYTLGPNQGPSPLFVLTNDVNAVGISSVQPFWRNSGSLTIAPGGTNLLFEPVPNTFGTNLFSYCATNQSGVASYAFVFVDVSSQPFVELTMPASNASTSCPANLVVAGRVQEPEGGIASVQLYVNGVYYGSATLSSGGFFNTNWVQAVPGFYTFSAVVLNSHSYSNSSQTVTVRVRPPNATNQPPVAIISSPAASMKKIGTMETSAPCIIREGELSVYGTALGSDNGPVAWQLALLDPDNPNGAPLYVVTPETTNSSGFRSGSVTNDLLGKIDLTRIENGAYLLSLVVRSGGDFSSTNVPITVDSNLKIGQFSFSEQDLVIPVSGIPLTVVRTYNSLNPREGDFGYSWSFTLNSMDVCLDDEREDVEYEDENGCPSVANIRTGGGWDVTLTLPDGRRTTFVFEPEVHVDLARSHWRPPADVSATLTNEPPCSDEITILPWIPAYWKDGGLDSALEYNDIPGWILRTSDGTKYYLRRSELKRFWYYPPGLYYPVLVNAYGPPKLTEIVQRTGDTLHIEDSRIFHTDANGHETRSIVFERDNRHRIIAIWDPISQSLNHQYPAVRYLYHEQTGNLLQVIKLVDRSTGTYVTNKYYYDHPNPNFSHYITSIEDGRGIQVARTLYDDAGRLIGNIDAEGHTTRISHDLAGRVEEITDRLQNVSTYSYDLRGNVTSVVNARQTNFYAYDEFNHKTNEVLGAIQTNSYVFSKELLLKSVIGNLVTNSFTYDDLGQLLTSTDPLGRATTNFYDALGNLSRQADCYGQISTNFYDHGLLQTSQDALSTTTSYLYDGFGNATNVTIRAADGKVLSKTSTSFDENNNRKTQTITRTLPGGSVCDATTTFFYDAQSRLIQTVAPDGGVTTTAYDAAGRQSMTTDSRGNSTRYEYDVRGLLSKVTYPDMFTEKYAYDAEGRRVSTIDRTGHETKTTFDPLGRTISVTSASNTPDQATTQTQFDSMGRVLFTIDARGNTNSFGYDSAGRRVWQVNAWLSAVSQTNAFAYDAAGNQTRQTDGFGTVTEFVYDARNRRIQTLQPAVVTGGARSITSTAYDGGNRRIAETNALNVVSLFQYDGLGRLLSVTNCLGGTNLGGLTLATNWATYVYDEAGNLTQQADALNRVTSFGYDSVGRRIWTKLPGGQITGCGYDSVGNLLYLTNADNVVISSEYDVMNRLSTRRQGTNWSENYSYTPSGRLLNRTDSSGSHSRTYDNQDRLITETTPVGTLHYSYDAVGNLLSLRSDSAGVNCNYQYDALSRLVNAVDNHLYDPTNKTTYSYNAAGSLQSAYYALAGVTNRYQCDARNRLTNTVWLKGSSTLATFGYALNAVGSRTQLTQSLSNQPTTFNYYYDTLQRLTVEMVSGGLPSGNLGYTLDRVGNRTSRTGALGLPHQTINYDLNDWVDNDSSPTNTNLYFDINGNARTNTYGAQGRQFGYDWANRLVAFTNGVTTGSITYDADGNRVKKTVGGTTTWYLVASVNPTGYPQVVEEHTGSSPGTVTRYYNYGLDLISQTTGSTTRFFGTDGLGSTRFLFTPAGAIAEHYAYDAFGTLIASNASPSTLYLFAGEQWDPELGLYYNRARYYNPGLGRFETRDTAEGEGEDPLSLHKYLYCKANPVNLTDPSGHGDGTVAGLTVTELGIAALAAFTTAVIAEVQTHAIRNLMQAAWTETMTDSGSAVAAAESALSVARTSCRQLIKDAKDILKQAGRLTANMKVVPMPRSVIRATANHVAMAQSLGFSPILQRVAPPVAAMNRAAALARRGSAGFGQSWDEYPFASGRVPGTVPHVAPVPWLENCIQGGIISGCYTIEKITPGTPFLVVVIP